MRKNTIFKLFRIILLFFLVGVTGVYGALNDNLQECWSFDNTLNGSAGNFSATNNGATYTPSGKVNGAYNYDGTNDFMDISVADINTGNDWTVTLWVKADLAAPSNKAMIGQYVVGDAGNSVWSTIYQSGNNQRTTGYNGATAYNSDYTQSTQTSWHHVLITYTNTDDTQRIYIDNVNRGNNTITGGMDDKASTIKWLIGNRDGGSEYFNGTIDEVGLWTRVVNVTERAEIYNSGTGLSCNYIANPAVPTITFQNISVNNETLINNTFFNTSILNFNITLNDSETNNNTNISYSLNGSSSVQFATNSLTGNFSLNLTDGSYNISFYAWNNETNTTSDLYFFVIDTFEPNISVNNFTEWNDGYNVTSLNTTLNITCSDPNLDYCEIHWDDNTTTNIGTTQYKEFSTNGNHTFTMHAHDLANNTKEVNGTIFINPNNYFQFQLSNGTQITNYTLNGTAWNDTAIYRHYQLGLGTHTLLFEKLGYVSQNISFTFNTTNELNITYNISFAQIIVNIYDRETNVLLNKTVDVNILTIGNQTTLNGTTIFQNISILPGAYHIQAISTGYYTEEQDFTYSGESSSIINFYLLNSTNPLSTTLVVPVIDEFFNIIEGADTRLLEYDSSILGFKQVSACKTNSNGECKFLIEINTKKYIITTSKLINGVLFTDQSSEEGEIFTVDISGGEEIPGQIILNNLVLKLSSQLQSPESLGLRVTVPANENETIVSENTTNTVINIPVSFTSDSGLSYTVCLEIYRTDGQSFFNTISPVCLISSSGILPTSNIDLNNDFDYQARVTITYDGVKSIYRTYYYNNENSFMEILLTENLASPFIILFWVLILSISMYLRSLAIWVYGAWSLSVIQFIVFPGYLVASSSVIIILINIGVLYVSKRQGDTL